MRGFLNQTRPVPLNSRGLAIYRRMKGILKLFEEPHPASRRGDVIMHGRKGLYFIALTVVLVLMFGLQLSHSTVAGAASTGNNPHDFSNKEECSSCHGSSMPSLSFDSVTVCTRCHEGFLGNHPVAKHPIGKIPEINITKLMPLSSDGKMVCYTCHDNHNSSSYPKMLRTDYMRLCSSCHRGY